MTLSDDERPDARNQIFFRWILLMLVRSATLLHLHEKCDLSATVEFLVEYSR